MLLLLLLLLLPVSVDGSGGGGAVFRQGHTSGAEGRRKEVGLALCLTEVMMIPRDFS